MKNNLKGILSIALLLLVVTACQKRTDCKASITCHDANGLPMSNVAVRLYANVKKNSINYVADVQANGITDKEGKVSFVFKLPAIFDIRAAVGTTTATSIIKLEEGKNTEKTVEFR